jgi:hypothetical protein
MDSELLSGRPAAERFTGMEARDSIHPDLSQPAGFWRRIHSQGGIPGILSENRFFQKSRHPTESKLSGVSLQLLTYQKNHSAWTPLLGSGGEPMTTV